jgi:hypothetical protein
MFQIFSISSSCLDLATQHIIKTTQFITAFYHNQDTLVKIHNISYGTNLILPTWY